MSSEDQHKSQFQARFKLNETRFGLRRKAVRELPIIDVGALTNGGALDARLRVAQEIREACINSGFFYISNYGVSEERQQEAVDWAHRFYNLTRDVKEKVRCHDIMTSRGYADSEKITPGYEPDFKEYYDMGLELDDESVPLADRGMVIWPDEDLPGFKEFYRGHIQAMRTVGQKIVQGFALSLDLPEDYFDPAFRQPYLFYRPSYYPPAQDKLKANLWSCGPHTDYMAFTMLYQDDVGGLEVMNLEGDWIDAPPLPGTQVFNIGDMMSSWTNDLYASTPHRVANRSPDRSRVSLATFMGPDSNTLVKCLETCQGPGNPPLYPPITTGQHVMNIFADSLPEDMAAAIVRENDQATTQFRDAKRIGA